MSNSQRRVLSLYEEGGRRRRVRLKAGIGPAPFPFPPSLYPDPTLERDSLLRQIVEAACEATRARQGGLILYNPKTGKVKIGALKGVDEEGAARWKGELLRRVMEKGRGVIARSTFGPSSRNFTLAVPLYIKGQIFGVLGVMGKKDGRPFTPSDLASLSDLSYKASLCIENHALYDSVYQNVMETFQSLVMTLEAKDPYTKEHSRRATSIALEMAEVIGLSEEEKESLQLGGWLHDIGKIGIKDSILSKPGSLTPEEYEIIKTHPLVGERILKPLGLLSVECQIIRNHHERWDGKGYPDGLRGKEIPFLARLFSVADSFEAMTSDRPYRKAKSIEEALQELEALSWIQFDGDMVKVLKEVVRRWRGGAIRG